MRLPIVAGPSVSPDAPAVVGDRIAASVPTAAIVPIDEGAALAFASLVLEELASVGAAATVVVESTSPNATALPTALVVHGATWRRITASDTRALVETFESGGPVLLIGTGLAGVVDASFVVAISGGRVSPMISPSFRDLRPRIDATIADPRPEFARWLAHRLVGRHP